RLEWAPAPQEEIVDWWPRLEAPSKKDRHDLNTAVTLICWSIWRHRNSVVFDGATPSVGTILHSSRGN
ncbi:hypothetical protein BRADI_2g11181v3, partial [Brachypodium distachyon]